MSTNYIICSASDVTPTSKRGGTGIKYPWLNKDIPVGKGFFIERTYEECVADKGRPTIPKKTLEQHGMKYKTYRAQRGLTHGYMCERVK